MTDTEIILHNLRDRDTESRAALARIVEERDACRASLEAATKRVDELEAAIEGILDYASWYYDAQADMWGDRRKERQETMKADIDRARAALAGRGE